MSEKLDNLPDSPRKRKIRIPGVLAVATAALLIPGTSGLASTGEQPENGIVVTQDGAPDTKAALDQLRPEQEMGVARLNTKLNKLPWLINYAYKHDNDPKTTHFKVGETRPYQLTVQEDTKNPHTTTFRMSFDKKGKFKNLKIIEDLKNTRDFRAPINGLAATQLEREGGGFVISTQPRGQNGFDNYSPVNPNNVNLDPASYQANTLALYSLSGVVDGFTKTYFFGAKNQIKSR